MGLNMEERKPLLREAAKRYQKAGTKKSAILDELVGYVLLMLNCGVRIDRFTAS